MESESNYSPFGACRIYDLPMELLYQIFSYLDARSFVRVSAVSSNFRQITEYSYMWRERCNVLWTRVLDLMYKIRKTSLQIVSTYPMDKEKVSDLNLLVESIDEYEPLAISRIRYKSVSNFDCDVYRQLLLSLLSGLQSTFNTLQRIESHPDSMRPSFDIFDLVLRRNMRQIDYMYSIPVPECMRFEADICLSLPPIPGVASSIIKDRKAREVWEKYIGKTVHAVDFDWFYERVLLYSFPRFATDVDFRDYFRFFTDFPRNGLMTTYKWAVIIDQFGPFDEFPENFKKYGCGIGFIGLVNNVESSKRIVLPRSFLTRFSRKEPEKITFSFKITQPPNSTIVTRHKRKPCGENFSSFVQSNFPESRNFYPIQDRIDRYLILVSTLEEYYEYSGHTPDRSMTDFHGHLSTCVWDFNSHI